MQENAIVLTCGYFDSVFAKTAHGLVRGPSRYPLAGVIDASLSGKDAGMVLSGTPGDIPFYASVADALRRIREPVTHCVVGVATIGGVLPGAVRSELLAAAGAGLTLVSGLHALLADDPALVAVAKARGGRIVDIRRPRPASELRFWTGAVYQVPALRIAVLGMDCAIGKRTTCMLLRDACRRQGLRTEMIYTGQTGWLQGLEHGFIFDATLNDFVPGELERAVVDCYRDTEADVILMEGQSGLRNPSGPAGSEFILSGAAHGVVLQHAPRRKFYEDYEGSGCALPSVGDEIALIRHLGCAVWAVALFTRGMTVEEVRSEQRVLEAALGVPVVSPLHGGAKRLAALVHDNLRAHRL